MENVCYVAYKDWFRSVEGQSEYDTGYSILTGTTDLQICVNTLIGQYKEDISDDRLYGTYGIQVYSNGEYQETLVLDGETMEINPVAFDVRKCLEKRKELQKKYPLQLEQ